MGAYPYQSFRWLATIFDAYGIIMGSPKMFLERSDGILLLVVLGRYEGAGWLGVLALTSIMRPHGCVDSKEDTHS